MQPTTSLLDPRQILGLLAQVCRRRRSPVAVTVHVIRAAEALAAREGIALDADDLARARLPLPPPTSQDFDRQARAWGDCMASASRTDSRHPQRRTEPCLRMDDPAGVGAPNRGK